MGHGVAKDLYTRLGEKIDHLSMRVPNNEAFYAILKEIFTDEEAELVVTMPYALSSFQKIRQTTRIEETRLRQLLDTVCDKGLVIDVKIGGEYHYPEYFIKPPTAPEAALQSRIQGMTSRMDGLSIPR